MQPFGLSDSINTVFESFLYHSRNARIVLLHPYSRYRSVLVARIVHAPELNTFYYALGPDDLNVQSFLSGMTHDLANQHPTFGRHVNMLPQEAWDETDKHFELLLDTFARDVSELSDQRFYFILDEYDRSDTADDIQQFVEGLVMRLPDNCCIILNSRTLPRLPWVSLTARGYAVLLEDTTLLRTDFYEVERQNSKLKLEVYALGPGFVLLDGTPIDTWEGHLPRLLFFFALDKSVITRSEICQAFWPELDIDQAVNVFHVTKRRLHKALDMDVLVHEDGYYRVNPEIAVYYDVMEFVTSLMDGRDENHSDRTASWQRAINLYRGPFLQGHFDKWIVSRRKDFSAGYLEALSNMATYWLGKGKREHALSLYQKALAEDIHREDLHRSIMELYVTLGRRSEAAAHYQRALNVLQKEGLAPSSELQATYEQIMS
jgi:DNA-binding SARP family transcriptional activator